MWPLLLKSEVPDAWFLKQGQRLHTCSMPYGRNIQCLEFHSVGQLDIPEL